MCGTCGCSGAGARLNGNSGLGSHDVAVADPRSHTVVLEQKVLARNDELAAANRAWLA